MFIPAFFKIRNFDTKETKALQNAQFSFTISLYKSELRISGLRRKTWDYWYEKGKELNPLIANPINWSTHSNISSAFADELFECVWPFWGVSA